MLDEKIFPMLAYPSEPFDSSRHIFEIKWDGTRCVLFVQGQEVRLQNRRLVDITHRYPELRGIHKEIRGRDAILDGELVVLSEGKPDFNKLQQREHSLDPLKVELLSKKMPTTYIAFDVLFLDGKRYTGAPLRERKEALTKILRESPHLVESQYVEKQGISFFSEVTKEGLEGVMAKSMYSPYVIGKRSRYWLKIKPKHSSVCYIVGYLEAEGTRKASFGSLVLATSEEENLVYRGRVGSGFTRGDIERISSKLEGLKTNSPPMAMRERSKGIQWVSPELRCEVSFQERTARGHFRAPVFKRLVE